MRIKKVSVKDCGPIDRFEESFLNLNVIYGKNERGKSFLVEFLIRCLFKNNYYWGYLRDIKSRGKVILEGLDEKDVEFSFPSLSRMSRKLENYFEKKSKGLPPSLSKLLVVKGGEFEITKDEAGIDKDFIKDLLSGKKILDSIKKNIPTTIQKAEIEDKISISRKGEGKRYYETEESLQKVNNLINDVVEQYEAGKIKQIEKEIEELKREKENLLKAKRYKAYLLSQEISKLEEELNKLPEEKISELNSKIVEFVKLKERRDSISKEVEEKREKTKNLESLKERWEKIQRAKKYQAYCIWNKLKQKEKELKKISEDELSELDKELLLYNEKNNELQKKTSELSELQKKTKHFKWLQAAEERYSKYFSSPVKYTKFIEVIPYFSLMFLLLGTLLILLGQKILGTTFMLLTGISGLWYALRIKKYFAPIKQKEEIESIREEFKEYFGRELNNIADIDSILEELKVDYDRISYLKNEISSIQEYIQKSKSSINNTFKKLLGADVNEEDWHAKLIELKDKRNDILSEIEGLKERFNKLDIDEMDFVKEDPGIKFEKQEFERIRKEVELLEKLKEQKEEKLNELQKYNDDLKHLEENIEQEFFEVIGEKVRPEDWKNKLQEIVRKRNSISEKIREKKGELKGLGVPEEEYEKQDPQVKFSPKKLKDIEDNVNKLTEERKKEEENLLRLKSNICSLTGLDYSSDWNDLIEALYLRREEIISELKEIESKIIAGKLVFDTIEEILNQEDEKIIEVMNSNEVTKLLFTLTKRYKNLSFDDNNNLLVGNEFETFSLKTLSTGAKEQVLLALRIGFIKKIMKQESAFLILDDAFQHSDYEKRPVLVESLVNLAESGWQIIYLTMDDNIKELFEKKASKLKDRYKIIEL